MLSADDQLTSDWHRRNSISAASYRLILRSPFAHVLFVDLRIVDDGHSGAAATVVVPPAVRAADMRPGVPDRTVEMGHVDHGVSDVGLDATLSSESDAGIGWGDGDSDDDQGESDD